LKKGLLRKSRFFDQRLVKKVVQGLKNVRLELYFYDSNHIQLQKYTKFGFSILVQCHNHKKWMFSPRLISKIWIYLILIGFFSKIRTWIENPAFWIFRVGFGWLDLVGFGWSSIQSPIQKKAFLMLVISIEILCYKWEFRLFYSVYCA
jgi:hypothetical protein